MGTAKKIVDLLAFVEREGMVLESGRHPSIPNLVEYIAGERIHGSWWGHSMGHEIYDLLNGLRQARDEVAVCKFIDGKVTYVHRRLWAACARLAKVIGPEHLDLIHSIHTDKGYHTLERTPLAQWLPKDVAAESVALDEEEARTKLARWWVG